MKCNVVIPKIANHVPHLMLKYDPEKVGVTVHEVQERLRRRSLRDRTQSQHRPQAKSGIPSDANTLVVGIWMLQPGEAEIVGRRIRAALTQKA